MPSFDVVSEFESHEATNAVDLANRQLQTRWDFRDADVSFSLDDNTITMAASDEFQLNQMRDILEASLIKRGIKASCVEYGKTTGAGKQVKRAATLRHGIDKDLAKKMVKAVKDAKLKVQTAMQGEQIRVTGKKRDDLQAVMALLKAEEYDIPLQFTNFRD